MKLKQADKSAAIAIEEYLCQMHLSGKCFCIFRFDEKIDNYILEKHGLNK